MDPNNRTWRLIDARACRRLLKGGALALLATAAASCSLSFPIAGFKADDAATGSIDRSSAFLALDREDLRRAKAALSIALDPQGNGGRVNWQNPETGARGAFAALAPPFTERDRVCRTFTAEVTGDAAAAERHLSGSACRQGDGSWELRETKDNGKV